MKTEICGECGEEKVLSEFSKDKNRKNGYCSHCKLCHKKYQEEHKEEISEQQKKYYDEHKEKRKVYLKKYREEHKKEMKKYQEEHKEEKKKYREEYKERKNNNRRKRYHSDIEFKIRRNLQTRLFDALKRNSKSASTLKLLGCSVEFLKKHLESQFKPGMSWDNHSVYGWHIDHIKPCSKFDLSKESEQRKCFHYINLQPLWAEDNLKKGGRYQDTGF